MMGYEQPMCKQAIPGRSTKLSDEQPAKAMKSNEVEQVPRGNHSKIDTSGTDRKQFPVAFKSKLMEAGNDWYCGLSALAENP